MRRIAIIIGVVAAVAAPSTALGDSGGATIRALPESQALQASVEVHHQCRGYAYGPTESCNWFATAAAYGAESGCPAVFDLSHGVRIGHAETYPGTSSGTFAFNPYRLPRDIVVCLYVNGEAEGLVGQSHPFDRVTHREILPQPKPAPKPKPPPAPRQPPVPTFHHSCGQVVARAPAYEIGVHQRAYAVFIRRGRMSCALARRTMASYLNGKGVEHNRNNIMKRYWTLPHGWRCGESTDGGHCTRGRAPVHEWIEAYK